MRCRSAVENSAYRDEVILQANGRDLCFDRRNIEVEMERLGKNAEQVAKNIRVTPSVPSSFD